MAFGLSTVSPLLRGVTHLKMKTRQESGGFKVPSAEETCSDKSDKVEAPAERPQYSIYRIPSAEGERGL
jgi:hypothetical protein